MTLKIVHICCIVMVALQLSTVNSLPVARSVESGLEPVSITTALNQITGGFRAVRRILVTNMLPNNGIHKTVNATILKYAQSLSKLIDQERKLREYLQMPEFENNTEIAALHELVGVLVKDSCNTLKSAVGMDLECRSTLWELLATRQLVEEEIDNALSFWCPNPDEECFLAPHESDREWVKKNIICSSAISSSTLQIAQETSGYSAITTC